MEGHGAIANANPMCHPTKAGKVTLKAINIFTQAADPAAAHGVEHIFFFTWAKGRGIDRDKITRALRGLMFKIGKK